MVYCVHWSFHMRNLKIPNDINLIQRRLGEFYTVTTADLFQDKNVVFFALPGAFTPTCSTQQLPGFEGIYDELRELGVDDVYCFSVNDAFVMDAWLENQNIKNVKMYADGNAELAKAFDMVVQKRNVGFGPRWWRTAAYVEDGVVKLWFEEPDKRDNAEDDSYTVTNPDFVYQELKTYLQNA